MDLSFCMYHKENQNYLIGVLIVNIKNYRKKIYYVSTSSGTVPTNLNV